MPYKIKYNERIFEYAEEIKWYLRDDMKCELSNSKKCLNDEVEIIEEDKKIEKLESYISCGWNGTCKDLKRDDLFNDLKKIGNKINEIIDKLNEMENE